MRFVPIKSVEQQAVLAVHRVRQGLVRARTAQANQIRGLLAEFGFIVPTGLFHVRERVPLLLERAADSLPLAFRQLIERTAQSSARSASAGQRARSADQGVASPAATLSRRLEKIPGIGPLTASALVASIADARSFANGRQLSAWLGLVPRQSSSGGKPLLLGISKRGDVYLRTLLIHGARAVIQFAQRKTDSTDTWLGKLLQRKHCNVAAVALASKNARTAWALLAHDREFQANHRPQLTAA